MAKSKGKKVSQPPTEKRNRRRPFDLSLIKRDFEDVLIACEKLRHHPEEWVRIAASFMSATLGVEHASLDDLELALALLGASEKIYKGALDELTPFQLKAVKFAQPFASLLWPAILDAIDRGNASQGSKEQLIVEFVRRHPIIRDSYGKTLVGCFPGLKDASGETLRNATNCEIVAEMRELWPNASRYVTENDVSKARSEQWGEREASRKAFLDKVRREGHG